MLDGLQTNRIASIRLVPQLFGRRRGIGATSIFPRQALHVRACLAIDHQGSPIHIQSMSANDEGFKIALEEAKKGASEGGVPIGACLVGADGSIIGRGHNLRVQRNSAILHVCGSFVLECIDEYVRSLTRIRLR